jgi:hypothetical protein
MVLNLLKNKFALSSLITLGSLITMTSTAAATSFYRVTFESLLTGISNDDGNYFSAVTFGFQDESFDIFDIGEAASLGIQEQAERGAGGTLEAEALAAGASQTVILASGNSGELPGVEADFFPGESASFLIELDPTDPSEQFLNFAAMFLPSNDAFIGSDTPIQLFDAAGNLTASASEILIDTVYDAGTEVNDQVAPNAAVARRDPTAADPGAPTAFPFNNVNSDDGGGTPQNGTVQVHPGYTNGGVFTLEGSTDTLTFTSPTDLTGPIARITIEEVTVPEPGTVTGILALGGLSLLTSKNRKKDRNSKK